jgi:hypothetical protein
MHWIFGAVLHATVLGVIAFFILFAAGKAEGFTALLGRLLGYWVLLLAIAGLVAGIYFGMSGKRPDMMMGSHPGWMHHWGPPPDGPMMQPAPAPAPAPKKP